MTGPPAARPPVAGSAQIREQQIAALKFRSDRIDVLENNLRIEVITEAEARWLLREYPSSGPTRVVNRVLLAAKQDPIISLPAAQDVTLAGARCANKREPNKRELVDFLRTRPEPLTSLEIAEAIGWDRHKAARRLSDAKRDGLVVNSPMRQCRTARRLAPTWKAVSL